MAGFGQSKPPDPGGHQHKTVPGLSTLSTPAAAGHPSTVTRSFASVTKEGHPPTATHSILNRFPSITLATRQYGVKEGKPSISFTPAELQAGIDNLRHTLVAKFSIGRPHIEDIRKAFLASWNLNSKCSIGAWDARHILIVLETEEEARKVLAHPLKKIGHSLFRVFRWCKGFNLKKEPPTMPAWIRLPSLPPEMYNLGYIEAIVSSFGRFLAVDNRTSSFSNPSFARVCVELDTTHSLPEEVWIATGKESGFWQGIEYESNLLYCSHCKLHGHTLDACRKTKRKNEAEQRIWAERDEFGLPKGAPSRTCPQSTTAKTQETSGDRKGVSAPHVDAPYTSAPHAKVPAESLPSGSTDCTASRHAELSLSDHIPRPADSEKQGWTLVEKKKQKQKSFKDQRTIPEQKHAGLPNHSEQPAPDTSSAPSDRTVPKDDGDVSCMPFARLETLDSEKMARSFSISVVPSPQGLVTTVIRDENPIDLTDEERIPVRKMKQMWKMEKHKDKLDASKNSYISLILSEEKKAQMQASCNLTQDRSTWPPLTMYSRTRDLDAAYVSKHVEDDPHYFRRANPYID